MYCMSITYETIIPFHLAGLYDFMGPETVLTTAEDKAIYIFMLFTLMILCIS